MSIITDVTDPAEREVFPSNGRPYSKAISNSSASISEDDVMAAVQRIFYQAAMPPKVVLLAGIGEDHAYGQIALAIGEALAQTCTGDVCVIETSSSATIRAEALTRDKHAGLAGFRGIENDRAGAVPLETQGLWLCPSTLTFRDLPRRQNVEGTKARLNELRSLFSYVIVHASPITPQAETASIAQAADGIVLIIEAGKTRREVARAAVSSLKAASIPIFGVILNNREFPIPQSIYRRL
jgi:hypothetical protein